MTASKPIAAAWFRHEDYDRIREISDDDMIPTFEQWEASMEQKLARLQSQGVVARRIIIDPDQLLAFGRAQSRKIDSQLRAQLAAIIFEKQQKGGH